MINKAIVNMNATIMPVLSWFCMIACGGLTTGIFGDSDTIVLLVLVGGFTLRHDTPATSIYL